MAHLNSPEHSTGQRAADRILFQLQNCSYSVGSMQLFHDLSLSLSHTEEILLVGPNGSGKSTLLRICAGLINNFTGSKTYTGNRPVSYLGHETLLYLDLTIRENLTLFAQLLQAEDEVEELIDRWSLTHFAQQPVRCLSQGTQIKAGICRALLGNPPLLILDEPTAALDDSATTVLLETLQERRRTQPTAATLLASHDVARLLTFGSRKILLSGGTLREVTDD